MLSIRARKPVVYFNDSKGAVSFSYRPANGEEEPWSPTVPTDAGTYVVKATDRIGNEKSEVFTVSYVEDKIEVSHTFADKTETKVGQQTVEFLIRSDAPIKQEGVKVTPKFVSDNSSVTTSGQLKEKEIVDRAVIASTISFLVKAIPGQEIF